MHGTIRTFTVKAKGKTHELKLEDILNENGTIEYRRHFEGNAQTYFAKPDVALFGEDVKDYSAVSKEAMEEVDVMLILGTSLQVTPFSYLPTYIKPTGKIIIINDEPVNPDIDYRVTLSFDYCIWDKITPVLKAIDKELENLSKKGDDDDEENSL